MISSSVVVRLLGEVVRADIEPACSADGSFGALIFDLQG
jgi:hypothetical protein